MKIIISAPNDCAHDNTPELDNSNDGTHNQDLPSLEEQYPLTLGLIYHRRQPRAAALISLLVPGFGGLGQLLLGQETKAGLLLAIEWFIVMPVGFFSKTLPYLLLSFHLLTALDAWVLAGRLIKRRSLKVWEWFWTQPSEQ